MFSATSLQTHRGIESNSALQELSWSPSEYKAAEQAGRDIVAASRSADHCESVHQRSQPVTAHPLRQERRVCQHTCGSSSRTGLSVLGLIDQSARQREWAKR